MLEYASPGSGWQDCARSSQRRVHVIIITISTHPPTHPSIYMYLPTHPGKFNASPLHCVVWINVVLYTQHLHHDAMQGLVSPHKEPAIRASGLVGMLPQPAIRASGLVGMLPRLATRCSYRSSYTSLSTSL